MFLRSLSFSFGSKKLAVIPPRQRVMNCFVQLAAKPSPLPLNHSMRVFDRTPSVGDPTPLQQVLGERKEKT